MDEEKLSSVLAEFGTTGFAGDRLGSGTEFDDLTPRERDVLDHLIAGAANEEIAITLGMRPKTVAHHCSVIYAKLGVRNRTEAASAAYRTGVGRQR